MSAKEHDLCLLTSHHPSRWRVSQGFNSAPLVASVTMNFS